MVGTLPCYDEGTKLINKGLFVYSYQGQFTILTSNQGLSLYVWQSITNAMGLVSGLILACL